MDLTSNLISELIGIIVTVFVVDRLISWRNKKKWKEVKNTFIFLAAHHTDKIIENWSKWLSSSGKIDGSVVSKYFEAEKKVQAYSLFRKTSPEMQKLYEEEAIKEKLESKEKMQKLLSAMGIDNDELIVLRFLNTSEEYELIKQIEDCPEFFDLIFYNFNIVEYQVPQTKIDELRAAVEPWIEKLSNLIDSYTLIIDERISLPVIKLSLAIHEFDYSTAWSLQDGFVNSLKLDSYFRRECEKLEELEDDDYGLEYTRLEKLEKLMGRLKAKLLGVAKSKISI